MNLNPNLVKALQHIGMLLVLGALSTAIIPAYTAIVTHVTSIAPTLPLTVQALISLLLPIIGAAVTKFQDEVTKQLQDEQNAQLSAKNIELASKNVALTKGYVKDVPVQATVVPVVELPSVPEDDCCGGNCNNPVNKPE